METCKKCAGEGLVGAGPNPHLREGVVSTCADCNGTGKVAVTQNETNTAPADVEEKKEEQVEGGEKVADTATE